jgi:hypothetical protein
VRLSRKGFGSTVGGVLEDSSVCEETRLPGSIIDISLSVDFQARPATLAQAEAYTNKGTEAFDFLSIALRYGGLLALVS